MPDERSQEVALNRFWNELIQCAEEPAACGLEPEQAEALRRLHAMSRTSPPVEAQARLTRAMRDQRVLQENGFVSSRLPQADVLPRPQRHLEGIRSPSAARREPQAPRPAHRARGWSEGFTQGAARPPRSPAAARASWPIAQFATALLLAVTLGLSYLSLDPVRRTTDRLIGIPVALFAPETLTPGVTNEEIIFEIALPAEAIPHGDRVSGGLSQFSLEPGKETAWDGADGDCCPGFRFDYVVEGSLAVRPAGQARVFRAGVNLATDIVPAGQEVTLEPGDAVMLRYEDAFESANPGTTPVHFLDISFIEGFFQLEADPPGWDWGIDDDVAYSLSVPNQPATLRLAKVDLAPGAIMQLPPGAVTQLGLTLADDAPLRVDNTEEVENINQDPVTVHVATLTPVQAEDLVRSSSR